MLKFLQGSSDADNLVQVAMNPDKYGKCLHDNAKQLLQFRSNMIGVYKIIMNKQCFK
jgi:uncharacterized protein YhfF